MIWKWKTLKTILLIGDYLDYREIMIDDDTKVIQIRRYLQLLGCQIGEPEKLKRKLGNFLVINATSF